MRKILLILLLLPVFAKAQLINQDQWGNHVFGGYVVPGIDEYLSAWIRTADSTFWAGGNDITLRGIGAAAAPQAVPTMVPVTGVKFQQVSNALHDDVAVSSPTDGNRAYIIGANNYGQWGTGNTTSNTNYHLIATDSAGNTFNNIKMVAGGWHAVNGGQFYIAIKNDNSLWGWGRMDEGGAGNQSAGTALRKPAQITLAGGKSAQFVQCTDGCLILCTDSTAQTFQNDNGLAANLGRTFTGTGNRSPADIGLTGIVGIANGYIVNWAWTATKVYAWGADCKLYGGQNHTTDAGSVTTPLDVTAVLNLPHPVKKIVCDHNATMFLLTDGELWTTGGIPTGIDGIGLDFDWANYTGTSGTTPYNGGTPDPWNWHVEYFNFTDLPVYVNAVPHQITPGKTNWANIFGSSLWGFNFGAVDSNNTFVMWGRNKGAVIPNGVFPADSLAGIIQADFHVSWDVLYPTIVNPFNVPVFQEVTSPFCILNPGTAPCPNYTIPTRTHPHASVVSATTTPGQYVLNGTASTSFFFYNKVWKQLSGPATVGMQIQTSSTDTVNLNTVGTYTFQYRIQDDVGQADSATATIIVAASAQTTFCIAAAGVGTACTSAAPCPLSYLPTLIPLLVAGDSLLFNRGDKFTGTLSIAVSGTQGSPIYIGAYGSGAGPAFDNRLTLTLTGGGANQTGTCTGCTANTRLLLFNGVPVSQARTPNMPQVFTYTPGSSTTTVLAVNSADLTAVGTITGKKVGIFPFPYAQAQGTVSSQTTNTVTFSPAMPTGFTGGNGWWVNGTTPDTIGEYTYSGGTSGTFTVNGSAGQTVQAATVDTTIAIYGNYVKVADANIFGANTVLLYLGGIGDSAFHDTTAFSGMDGVEVNARRVHINRISTNYCNNIGINNLSLSDTGTSILNNTVLNSGTLPGMQQTGNSQAIGIVSPAYGSVIKYNTVVNSGGNAIYSGGADSIWVRKNYIHDFNQTWIDGGGVYFWVNSAVTATFGRFIDSNLIQNGGVHPWSFIGKSINNSSASFAVYLDSHTNGVTVSNNTSWNMVSGFGQNHGPSNTWTNNSFGQDQYVGFLNAQFVGGPTLTSVVFSGNTSYDSLPAVPLIRNITLGNDSTTILTADNNVYVHATNTFTFWTKNASNAGAFFNLSGWKAASGQDAHSTFQGLKCTIVTNPLFTVADQKFGYVGKSVDGKSTIYRNVKKAQPSISGSILQVVNIGQFWRYKKM